MAKKRRFEIKKTADPEFSSDKVNELYGDLMDDFKRSLIEGIEKTESPIEQLMLLSLRSIMLSHSRSFEDLMSLINYAEIEVQAEIITNGGTHKEKTYYPDLLIRCDSFRENKTFWFVIECDGHDFHEKTKEQARKDKERERNLLRSGYIVIRFSGSEIHENHFRCASETFDIIHEYIKRVI